jgi:hypothetical protein
MLLSVGCVPHVSSNEVVLPWTFEARPTAGRIMVVPVIDLTTEPVVNLDSPTGRALPPEWAAMRRQRTQELGQVAGAIGQALPGAVNGQLGFAWKGQFKAGQFAVGGRDRLKKTLLSRRASLDRVLAEQARAIGGEATLFTWVVSQEATPISAQAFPGFSFETPVGPVVVDPVDEPYMVEARIGLALVTRDGEVVLRYEDQYRAVLSSQNTPERVGRTLARSLAEEVGPVWAIDPRLWAGEPVVARSP